MAGHLEIERKFLVERPPSDWKRREATLITQGYLPIGTKGLEIRLRRKGSHHFLTIKDGRGLRRLEAEIALPASTFRALWPLTRGARITKRRYALRARPHTIEMDVYQGPHRGLITAEIEFDSVRESRSFQPPQWLGQEITGRRRYANEALARRKGVPRRQAPG